MSDIAAKVLANDDMPGRTVSSVKLFLDLSGNVFLDVVFLESGRCDVNALLLHLLAHVDIFNDCFWGSAGKGGISGSSASISGGWGVHDVWVRDEEFR